MAVLLTGANGFFGNYLQRALADQGLTTLGLSGCDYNVDLSVAVPEFRKPFNKVVHAAGMAHIVPKSKETEQRFFDVNVTGTIKSSQRSGETVPVAGNIYFHKHGCSIWG